MSEQSDLVLHRSFGRLEGKVDALLTMLKEQSHETRISSLEKWRTRSTAWLAGASAAVAFIGVLVWKALTLHR